MDNLETEMILSRLDTGVGVNKKLMSDCLAKLIHYNNMLLDSYTFQEMEDQIHTIEESVRLAMWVSAELQNAIEAETYAEGKEEDFPEYDFDISKQTIELCNRARFILRKSTISLSVDIEPKIFCRCDPKRYEMMFANLLINAFQNVEQDDGKIAVRIKKFNDVAAVTITDDGYGLSSEDYSRMIKTPGKCGGLKILSLFCNHYGIVPVIDAGSKGTVISVRIPLSNIDNYCAAPDGRIAMPHQSPAELLFYKHSQSSVSFLPQV